MGVTYHLFLVVYYYLYQTSNSTKTMGHLIEFDIVLTLDPSEVDIIFEVSHFTIRTKIIFELIDMTHHTKNNVKYWETYAIEKKMYFTLYGENSVYGWT